MEVNLRQLVLLSHSLGTEMLLDSNGVVSSTLDGAVVGDNDAGDALNDTDTSDDATSGHVGLGIQLMAGKGRELHESSSRVDQSSDAVTRQHLLASQVLGPGLLGPALLDLARQLLDLVHDDAHLLLVLLELVGGRVNGGLNARDGGGLMRRGKTGDGADLDMVVAARSCLAGELTAQAQGLVRCPRQGHCE